MATYGYAGDFSSDDDEKVEERMVQNKYDNVRPNKKQIEEEIESIRQLPYDQEINLDDDILAALLDYYKTQRGPIVDSTRKLYNKIALRLVRGDQDVDGAAKESSNGNAKVVNDNNNSINIISKGPSQASSADAFSSDDDEIEVVETNSQKRFDSRVVYDNLDTSVDDDQMDIDSETPTGPVRETKQVDLSTTTDEDEESSTSEDELSETDDELNSGSDAPEVTPIKPPVNREKEAIEVLMAMRPSTPKQSELKKNQMAHSTPKESVLTSSKKPYTRSQRVATRSATRSTKSSDTTASKADKKEASSSRSDVFLETRRVSRRSYTIVAGASVVLLLAVILFYFRSTIMNTAEPMLRKKISF